METKGLEGERKKLILVVELTASGWKSPWTTVATVRW